MDYGAHLPLIRFDAADSTLDELRAYARHAAGLQYRYLCANDHLLFARPWLDGLTAPAATIDPLSDGRLVAGVGPGSSARDYAAAGVPFGERWQRFDEAIRALRSLLGDQEEGFAGKVLLDTGCLTRACAEQSCGAADLGGELGLAGRSASRRSARRRLARVWLQHHPVQVRDAPRTPAGRLGAAGRDRTALPNAIVTMWLYVSESRRDAERMLREVLAPTLNRSVDVLRDLALPIGSAAQCAERISAFRDAGAQRIFVWPLADELQQLSRFREDVVPLVDAV